MFSSPQRPGISYSVWGDARSEARERRRAEAAGNSAGAARCLNSEVGSSRAGLGVTGATLGWTLGQGEVLRRIDQTDMRKSLREVAKLATCPRVILLSQETDVVPDGKQPLEDLRCLVLAAHQCQGIGQPEGAGEEGAFPADQSVDTSLRPIALYEAVERQLASDCLHGA